MAEEQLVPFSEGSPPDNLQIEDLGDSVLIGDPSLDEIVQKDDEFDSNLAAQI